MITEHKTYILLDIDIVIVTMKTSHSGRTAKIVVMTSWFKQFFQFNNEHNCGVESNASRKYRISQHQHFCDY